LKIRALDFERWQSVQHRVTARPPAVVGLISLQFQTVESEKMQWSGSMAGDILHKFLENSADVDGWFDNRAAAMWDALLSHQRANLISGDLLEIGVWHGKSALLAAMHCGAQEKLLLVDPLPLQAAVDVIEKSAPGTQWLTFQGLSNWLLRDQLYQAGAKSYRWIHIDGEHTAQAVNSDLKIANHLLSDDGVVVLDDFFSESYPQITQALFSYLHSNPSEFSFFLCGGGKGYLCRPMKAPFYLGFVKDKLYSEMEQRKNGNITIWKSTVPSDGNAFGVTDQYLQFKYRGPDWAVDEISI
jgi:hypothetical protein